ncbi:hypothetical protein Tcan_11705 [Toxocara canis]|uniref:Uncharacterized protein n=1 Tax=Toxocara canis TaxID=6265 RepID=A0A0B2V3G7_TOXCA|nr:hypothetical protein Tcan_11705 [Toxocara canis]
MAAEAMHSNENLDLIGALEHGVISIHRHGCCDAVSGKTLPLKVLGLLRGSKDITYARYQQFFD